MLSGTHVATIRKQRGWSQQRLAILCDVNKAYISEYESGIRDTLPEDMLSRMETVLRDPPAGRTSAKIDHTAHGPRLVLRDRDGNDIRPPIASIHWTEDDGTSYTMYLGETEPST